MLPKPEPWHLQEFIQAFERFYSCASKVPMQTCLDPR